MTRIAVYDSGVGGLTIYREVQAAQPNAEYVFVSDNEAYPYGTKSDDELLQRVSAVAESICVTYQPDILILACNTASTVCLPMLRERLDIPVVGVVPAIKPAAELSNSKVIGLLATPATVQRNYTDKLIQEFAGQCQVIKVGSKELVDMAEAKMGGKPIDTEQLELLLSPFIETSELDTLVLACTHFPLLKTEIEQSLQQQGKSITLVDSGQAIAKRVGSLLAANGRVECAGSKNKTNRAVFTNVSNLSTGSKLEAILNELGFSVIEQLSNLSS